MKVSDLRSAIAEHDPDSLRKLVVELYKMVPAKVREERRADELIRRPDAARELRASRSARAARPDPDRVLDDARWFLENAAEQNYFAPNRVIPKKERAQWRFAARRVYKDLVALSGLEEHREDSAEMLAELFRILCRAEREYLFSSTEPFEAMKVPQEEVLHSALAAARGAVPPERFLDVAIDLVLSTGGGWAAQPLVPLVVAEASSPELRDRLAERALARYNAPGRGLDGVVRRIDKWTRREMRRTLAAVVMGAHAANAEAERGLERYRELTAEDEPWEVASDLLHLLADLGLDDLWAREYDRAAERGVQFAPVWEERREKLAGAHPRPER